MPLKVGLTPNLLSIMFLKNLQDKHQENTILSAINKSERKHSDVG
jgi:hypothetical protein